MEHPRSGSTSHTAGVWKGNLASSNDNVGLLTDHLIVFVAHGLTPEGTVLITSPRACASTDVAVAKDLKVTSSANNMPFFIGHALVNVAVAVIILVVADFSFGKLCVDAIEALQKAPRADEHAPRVARVLNPFGEVTGTPSKVVFVNNTIAVDIEPIADVEVASTFDNAVNVVSFAAGLALQQATKGLVALAQELSVVTYDSADGTDTVEARITIITIGELVRVVLKVRRAARATQVVDDAIAIVIATIAEGFGTESVGMITLICCAVTVFIDVVAAGARMIRTLRLGHPIGDACHDPVHTSGPSSFTTACAGRVLRDAQFIVFVVEERAVLVDSSVTIVVDAVADVQHARRSVWGILIGDAQVDGVAHTERVALRVCRITGVIGVSTIVASDEQAQQNQAKQASHYFFLYFPVLRPWTG